MAQIQIKTYFHGKVLTETVEADVIGELAVYQLNGLWTIGHILSGAWIAAFTHKHVAINLAKRIMSLYSIDYYFQVEDKAYRQAVSDSLRNWRKHVAFRDQNVAKGHHIYPDGSVR